MQRHSTRMPTVSAHHPGGNFAHGAPRGPHQSAYDAGIPNHISNGISPVSQNRPYNQGTPVQNYGANTGYRHRMPANSVTSAYLPHAYPQADVVATGGGSYPPVMFMSLPSGLYDPAQYGLQYVNLQYANPAHANGVPTFAAYARFPGPAAMEISHPPQIAQHPQPPQPPPGSVHQLVRHVIPASTVPPPTGTNVGQGSPAQPPPLQGPPFHQPPPPIPRNKNVLQVVDPNSGKDLMEDMRKEYVVVGMAHCAGQPKPPPPPMVANQHNPMVNQSSSGGHTQSCGSVLPNETIPPQFIAPTIAKRPEQRMQAASEGRCPRRQSATVDDTQTDDAKLAEFYAGFTQQLSDRDRAAARTPSELEQDPHLHRDAQSADTAHCEHIPGQSADCTMQQPTPVVSAPIEFAKAKSPTDITVAPSGSNSDLSSPRKPKDIIGESEIEFFWSSVSTGDKVMDTGDAELAEMDTSMEVTASDSVPQQRQPTPPDATVPCAQMIMSSQTGRNSDVAPSPIKEASVTNQQPESSPTVPFNQDQADSLGPVHRPSTPSSFPTAHNDSAIVPSDNYDGPTKDGEDTLEEGEIRDSPTFNHSGPIDTFTTNNESAVGPSATVPTGNTKLADCPRLYNREFMVAAAEFPMSKCKPQFRTVGWTEEAIDAVLNLNRQAKTDFVKARPVPQQVPWMPGPSMEIGTRKPYPGRTSDTSTRMGKGSRQRSPIGRPNMNMPRQQPVIIAPPPMTVDLKPSENAWKPRHIAASTEDPEMAETKKLFKEVRGLLNKITPQTFEALAEEFLEFEERMDTEERARGVVDIVFQKVVVEQEFCVMYSQLIVKMAVRQQQKQQQQQQRSDVQEGQEQKKTIAKETNFRWILLSKCQSEYERDKSCETTRQERENAISVVETAAEKKKLQEELDEFVQKEKRRTLGNMRFIGELFISNMLTSNIVHRCIMELLKKSEDEESLECLCKLLTTIGKRLDAANRKESELHGQTDGYYKRLQELATSLGSRIRFMIQDLLELRASSWQPRRKTEGPKTMQQLHEDAEREKLEKELELQEMEEKKKQEAAAQIGRGGGRRDRSGYGQDDYRGGKGDRPYVRDRDRQNWYGGRPNAGAGNQQQFGQPPCDFSKAKPPALSQHFGADEGVKLGPQQRWNKLKSAPNLTSSMSDSKPVKSTYRYDRHPKPDAVRVYNNSGGGGGGSVWDKRDSSQVRVAERDKRVHSSEGSAIDQGNEQSNTATETMIKKNTNETDTRVHREHTENMG